MGETCPEPGRLLVGKYRLEHRLGEGGFGSIWRAEHLILKAPVAVKIIDPDVARREGALDRFLREAQATATLRSPHVVQILDYGIDQGLAFIVMELLEGENLAERMRRTTLSAREIVRIVTQVGRAIDRAHEAGIVHRDLKPENVFLVRNGDDEMVKILDFGVAKTKAGLGELPSSCTQTGSLIGTPYYMSPEQAQGNKTVDHRTDLWALGVMVFEMFTGRRPFDSEALGDLVLSICIRPIPVPSTLRPELSPRFDAWFAHATERDPALRFQSARELAAALVEAVGEELDVRSLFEEPLALEQKNGPRLAQVTPTGETPLLEVAPFAATVLDEDPKLRDDSPSAPLHSRPQTKLPTPDPISAPRAGLAADELAPEPPRVATARRHIESERRIFGEFWLGVVVVMLLAVLVATMLLSRRAREWWRGSTNTIEPVPITSVTRPSPQRERTNPRAATSSTVVPPISSIVAPTASPSLRAEPSPPTHPSSRPALAPGQGSGHDSLPHTLTPVSSGGPAPATSSAPMLAPPAADQSAPIASAPPSIPTPPATGLHGSDALHPTGLGNPSLDVESPATPTESVPVVPATPPQASVSATDARPSPSEQQAPHQSDTNAGL